MKGAAKRVIAVALCFLLGISFFSACSNGSTEDEVELIMGEKYDEVDTTNIEKVRETGSFIVDEDAAESKDDFVPEPIISDNMVLQRNAVTRLWGQANFNGEYAVGINGKVFYGTAENGAFEIFLAPMQEGGPYELVLYGPSGKYTIDNVMVGEVLLFSGQSNMMWTVSETLQYGKQDLKQENRPESQISYLPDIDADPETYYEFYATAELKKSYMDIAASQIQSNLMLRFCELNNGSKYGVGNIAMNEEPQDTIDCRWSEGDESAIKNTSMFAYYFSKRLQADTGMAVGVVVGCWGGTYVSAWTPREVVEENHEAFSYIGNTQANSTSRCYNSFISPVLKYKFKAVVWYQGEGQPDNYARSMQLMIASWRENFEDENLGFLIVEIPRYGVGGVLPDGMSAEEYQQEDPYTGMPNELYFNVRAQQQLIAEQNENCVLSVSIDQGDYDDIHPTDKRDIAKYAESKFVEYFYAAENTLSGPVAVSAERYGDDILITFENIGKGLSVKNGGVNFEVSEDGTVFYETRAEKFSDNQVLVRIGYADLDVINYVRYGALDYPRVSRIEMSTYLSVYNAEGYPCDQFIMEIE